KNVTYYAFEIRDGRLKWTDQASDKSETMKSAIASDFFENVLLCKDRAGMFLKSTIDWNSKGKDTNSTANEPDWLPTDDPSIGNILAVKSSSRYAIAKPSTEKGKEAVDVVEIRWKSITMGAPRSFDVSTTPDVFKAEPKGKLYAMGFDPKKDR